MSSGFEGRVHKWICLDPLTRRGNVLLNVVTSQFADKTYWDSTCFQILHLYFNVHCIS